MTEGQELLYLDDLAVGQRFSSPSHAVDEAGIKAFAREYDLQPFHLDEAAAASSLFGGLAASGWHTAAISMRLLAGSVPLAGGVIGAGGEIAWPCPTRPGDVLTVGKRPMSEAQADAVVAVYLADSDGLCRATREERAA